ncbi:MAG: DNA primase, partial [Deltaproteobacteria bacterium]|nr:DNA primase [Deltaproteobacteria bacterium]
MSKISPDLLQKIKSAVNLIEIIGEHIVLKKAGSQYVGLCPFHSERTPSFSVSEQKQLYHCYGCKLGGDLITFVMDILSLSFPEAIEELASRARIELPKEFFQDQRHQNPMQSERFSLFYKLNRFVAAFYHQTLKDHSNIENYILSRGVNPQEIKNFYLGFATLDWDNLAKHLESKKAPLGPALELGLIRPSQKQEGGYYDLFRNRVMFPILNSRGKISGFGGRIIDTKDNPKYLNSNDSLIFQKSKLAYGLFQAQKHIRDLDTVIIVEGYFDVLAMHSAGFHNVIASCGTSLTEEHLKLLRKLASKIILLFDGDQAGKDAMERSMVLGLKQGLVLYGTALPDVMDPDEILFDQTTGQKKDGGNDQMKEIIAQAFPLLDNNIENEIKRSHKNLEEKTIATKKIAEWLALFQDPIGREIRMQKVSQELGIQKELFGLKPILSKQDKKPSLKYKNTSSKAISVRDKILLCAVLQDEAIISLLLEHKKKLP